MTVKDLGRIWDRIPGYAQLMVTFGGFIFYTAMLYGDVQYLKEGQKRIGDSYANQAKLAAQIGFMQEQLKAADRNQERSTIAMENLGGSLNRLSESLARLDERLKSIEKRRR